MVVPPAPSLPSQASALGLLVLGGEEVVRLAWFGVPTELGPMNDDAPSNVGRLRELADDSPDQRAYVHLAMDGSEVALTWSELHRRSNQVAAALAARGVGYADRVGLGIRNSPEFVFAVLATWKLGAVPVPVRWDVPGWELERLKEVIQPTVYLGPDDLDWIRATVG